jgi:hypothetical protein
LINHLSLEFPALRSLVSDACANRSKCSISSLSVPFPILLRVLVPAAPASTRRYAPSRPTSKAVESKEPSSSALSDIKVMRGGTTPLSDRGHRPNPNAPGAYWEGADAPTGRRVAWFSRQSKDPGHRWPRDAPTCRCSLLRLRFPERNQNLYTIRAVPVRSCPHPASLITACLRTQTHSLALHRNSNQKVTMPPLDPTLRPLLRSPCGYTIPTDSSTVPIPACQLAHSGAHAPAVCTRAARQGFSLSTDVCL